MTRVGKHGTSVFPSSGTLRPVHEKENPTSVVTFAQGNQLEPAKEIEGLVFACRPLGTPIGLADILEAQGYSHETGHHEQPI